MKNKKTRKIKSIADFKSQYLPQLAAKETNNSGHTDFEKLKKYVSKILRKANIG